MQVPVEELFLQVEREEQFDKGYDSGYDKGKSEGFDEANDKIIMNMLSKSVKEEVIQDFVGCSRDRIRKIKDKHFASK